MPLEGFGLLKDEGEVEGEGLLKPPFWGMSFYGVGCYMERSSTLISSSKPKGIALDMHIITGIDQLMWVLPQDYQHPAQELVAKDLHGVEWRAYL
jgi:hypothetical protein